MRNTLLFIALAAALACGASGAHAGATAAEEGDAFGFPPAPAPMNPRKIDEYGRLRWSDEKARLDNYVMELRRDPTMRACIICYGGRKGRAGEARRRCARAAGYLERVRGVAAARIVTIDGGFREELTVELWPAPAGASLPQASPTVDPSEVRIIKGRPRRARAKR